MRICPHYGLTDAHSSAGSVRAAELAVVPGHHPLDADYHPNLGATRAADGACCNFLRVNYADLRERVLQGGTDEEILEWCFERGRRLNDGDLMIWNSFNSKLGWNDFASPRLEREKQKHGIVDRDDIVTISDLIDFDEGRKS